LWNGKKAERFFDGLCEDYYEKVLRYLYAALADEQAARDIVQEVFLVAWQKREALLTHPNPGGFLFLTAKNLAQKARREAFVRMAREELDGDGRLEAQPDGTNLIETALDRAVDESAYIDAVLGQLSPEKQKLYSLYYIKGWSMSEIAAQYHLEETAVRMRYVRLRREIRAIAAEVAQKEFSF